MGEITEKMDDDRLELLERRLAEKVTKRVQADLFKLYGAVGTAVLAVFIYGGWDFKAETKREIRHEITKKIENELRQSQKTLDEHIATTKVRAEIATSVIKQVQEELEKFQPHAMSLRETIDKVEAFKEKSRDLVETYERDLTPLNSAVDSLSRQLRMLAVQVKKLNDPNQSTQQRDDIIDNVITVAQAAEGHLAEARNKTTVYFQFAGGRREQAKELSKLLKGYGYIVPGEDREKVAAEKREVRYFYAADKIAADNLVADLKQALGQLQYEGKITEVIPQDHIGYPGEKPRPGVIELWLEIPWRAASSN